MATNGKPPLISRLHLKIEKMWWSHDKPPAYLRAISHLYKMINHYNLKSRKKRASSPMLAMISVGNLTAGGSGKTPFVIWLTEKLKKEGYKPVIISRGDGGKTRIPQLLNHESDPLTVGDEAVLLYQKCDCPIIAGHDRVRASRMAAEYGDVMILDDGFQYRQLERLCDIVLIPEEGIGNAHLIPAGPLREPVKALERADLIVRTASSDHMEKKSDANLHDKIKAFTTNKEWYWWSIEDQLTQIAGKKSTSPKLVTALTAIARPQRFIQSIERLGIHIKNKQLFPDHHPFSKTDIALTTDLNNPVITTSKDAVKLQNIWPGKQELWVLEQRSEAESGLFEMILKQIT